MSCWYVEVRLAGDDDSPPRYALQDSVGGWVFGPTFDSIEQIHAFCLYCYAQGTDPRALDEVELAATFELFGGNHVSNTN